jgi:hypothetical protein
MIHRDRWISSRFIYTHQDLYLRIKDRAYSFIRFFCWLLRGDSCLRRFRRLRLPIGDQPSLLASSLRGESSSVFRLKIHLAHYGRRPIPVWYCVSALVPKQINSTYRSNWILMFVILTLYLIVLL